MKVNNWSAWENERVEWIGRIPIEENNQEQLTLDLSVDVMAVLVKYDWYNLFYEEQHLQPFVTRDLLRETIRICNERRSNIRFKPIYFLNIDPDLLK